VGARSQRKKKSKRDEDFNPRRRIMPRFDWYFAPIAAIFTVMSKWRMEAVDSLENKVLKMPTADKVCEILKSLWMICSGEKSGDGFDLPPEGEFGIPRQRTSEDRIFRVRDFEGRRTVMDEYDGGPGRGGLDVLGKYTLKNSLITIYVDSCRKAELEYGNGSWELRNLIDVVLIHELAHLITHQCFYLKMQKGGEIDHLWEYTAQCATYAYLKSHGEKKDLEVFKQLSPHQPFIYKTWEGLKAVESVQSQWCGGVQSTEQIAEVVKSIFTALKQPAPTPDEMATGYRRSDEGG
jgi:hypothetical protein